MSVISEDGGQNVGKFEFLIVLSFVGFLEALSQKWVARCYRRGPGSGCSHTALRRPAHLPRTLELQGLLPLFSHKEVQVCFQALELYVYTCGISVCCQCINM